MKHSVIAIGLDAADPLLIEAWIAEGHLKNLRRLQEKGLYTRLETFDNYRAETPWTTFLTGCSPQQTGYWSPVKLTEGTYTIKNVEAYDFVEYKPFYALGNGYKVAAFDIPQSRLSEDVNGLQMLAWGAHSALTPRASKPQGLFQEVVNQHGDHPVFDRDHADIRDVEALKQLQANLEVGIARRSAICQDLLQRDNWDLFLTVFGETHAAGHFFWHLSQSDQPLNKVMQTQVNDLMLKTFIAVDQAIGEILEHAPENASVIVYAAHGMGTNVMDLPSMLFLPELLYRFSFPGHMGLASNKLNAPLPNPTVKHRRDWLGDVWRLKHEPGAIRQFLRRKAPNKISTLVSRMFRSSQSPDLVSPYELVEQQDPFFYQPASWYKPCWAKMKAFALPSFSEGYIRINLQGREPDGIVTNSEYDAVCDEVSTLLYQLKDGRTGKPMVKNIIRTRQHPTDCDSKLPDADLIVLWQEDYATDVVDSAELGRVGPVPYLRTGSHRARGFFLAQGPAIEKGQTLSAGHALDLAPTILQLIGAPIPAHFEGKPLLKTSALVS